MVSSYVLGAFVVALISDVRATAITGAIALGLGIVSFTWNPDVTTLAYLVRIVLLAAGVGLAVLAAAWRGRLRRSSGRLSVLAAIGEVADGSRSLEETVRVFNERLVPELAEIAIFDAIVDGELRRLDVRIAEPGDARLEGALRDRQPHGPDKPLGAARAVVQGEPHLFSELSEDLLRAISHDESDLELLRAVGPRSAAVVPLRARDRVHGALTLITTRSGRHIDAEDFEFIKVVAGRAALALDNAGLFRELGSVERQLEAVLHGLADAVIVQDADRVVYANEAAAGMLGSASVEELLATPADQLAGRFETATQDGSEIDPERLPGRRVLRGESPRPLTLRVLDRETGEESWRIVKATAVTDAEGEPSLAVTVIEDVTPTKRAEVYQRLLSEAGRVLSGSLDWEATLQQAADVAVPEFADWCAVGIPRGAGLLTQVAVAHVDPEKVRVSEELNERYPEMLSQLGLGGVLNQRTSLRVEVSDERLRKATRGPEQYELLEGLGLRSVIASPMRVGNHVVGVITFVTAESGRSFTDGDVAIAEELARRAATAVENARLYRDRSATATTLENALLPPELPEVPGWRMATLYQPAAGEGELGGDFFDAFPVDGGSMVIIGDICGRGVLAASLTTLARYTLRTAGSLTGDPVTAVDQLNRWLSERGEVELCTVAAVVLRDDGRIRLVSAGHPPPLLVRGGEATPLELHGPMLGVTPDVEWPVEELELSEGDELILYTDGATDVTGVQGRFGEARLRQTLGDASDPEDAVHRVDEALTAYGSQPYSDDTAMVAIMRVAVAEGAAERQQAPSLRAATSA